MLNNNPNFNLDLGFWGALDEMLEDHLLCILTFYNFLHFYWVIFVCAEKDGKTIFRAKKLILTSKRLAEPPFAGQNKQQPLLVTRVVVGNPLHCFMTYFLSRGTSTLASGATWWLPVCHFQHQNDLPKFSGSVQKDWSHSSHDKDQSSFQGCQLLPQ